MTSVSVSELKANLSRYLREVRRGGEFQVLDRGEPIAWLKPTDWSPSSEEEEEAAIAKLIADGVLRAGKGRCDQILTQPRLNLGVSIVEALLEDRGDRF